jgi:type VI secretion system protein VasJ
MDISHLGITPISDEDPAGKDVRYEVSFESLSSEIAKLGSPSASKAIDWNNVISLAAGILEKESKHLQVASYLCYALVKTRGMEGFCQGVGMLRTLVENFWDTMFPPKKRMKGRRSIIVWWEGRVSEFVGTTDAVSWEKKKRDALIADLTALDAFLGEKMEDAPLLRPLISKVSSAVLEKKAAEIEPENLPETETRAIPSAETPPAAPSPKPAVAKPADDADAGSMLKQGLGLISKAATSLRKQAVFDPLPYRLNRIVAWMPIKDLPVATGGKTMLPPPDKQSMTAVTSLYDNAKWLDLVNACESRIKQDVFWLDLSRYVAESMEQLGHQNISDVIGTEASAFVKQMQGIENLCFSDGTPFADPATREWLKQLGQSRESDHEPAGGHSKTDTVKQNINEKMGEAQALVKEKKVDAALFLLTAPLAAASSGRERFLWKLAVCRLLINARQIHIASSYIDDMLDAVDTYKLEKWEPHNAIEAFSLALTGLRLQKDSRHEEKISSIIKKISMLDPIMALKIV